MFSISLPAVPVRLHLQLGVALLLASFGQHGGGAAGHEHHLGHEAAGMTLMRRENVAADSVAFASKFQQILQGRADNDPKLWHLPQLQVAAALRDQEREERQREYDRVLNITTELQDMKSEYTGLIGVGTTQKGEAVFQARVVFDTGSTNLWVASVLCQTSPCDDGRNTKFYDPEKSITEETYTGRGGDIDIMFGTGELKGPLHVDTYRVGPMEVKQQPFAMIREMTGDVFSSFQFEGILGLAFKSLSFGGITPFFERVIEQKLLKNNEFAFYLNGDSDQPSALLWGGVDKDLYEGPITMFPVVQLHYWAIELVEFRIGNAVLGGSRHQGSNLKKLIIDSGTTYFTTPSELYSSVVQHMPEAPCAQVEDYKPLTYVLRGTQGETFELIVTQETYMIGSAGDEGSCRPAFMALDVNEKYGPALILGEVFMRHFFTVFARGSGLADEARVGFAAAKIGAVPKVASRAHQFQRESAEVLAVGVEGGHVLAEQQLGLAQASPATGSNQSSKPSSGLLEVASREGSPQAMSTLQTPAGAKRFVRPSREKRSAAVASGASFPTSSVGATTDIIRRDIEAPQRSLIRREINSAI